MSRDLEAKVSELCAGFSGDAGVSAIQLTNGDSIAIRADVVFPTASAIKVLILVALHRAAEDGDLDLAERVEISAASHLLGSGVLAHLGPGLCPTLGDLGVLMMMLSDNTATNVLIERLGVDRINESADPEHMRLVGAIDFARVAEDPRAFGTSTPNGLAELYQLCLGASSSAPSPPRE